MKKAIGIILAIMGIALAAIGILLKKKGGIAIQVKSVWGRIPHITLKRKGKKAVSIIGASDGPTSVFLAGKIGKGFWMWPLIFIGAGIFFIQKK